MANFLLATVNFKPRTRVEMTAMAYLKARNWFDIFMKKNSSHRSENFK